MASLAVRRILLEKNAHEVRRKKPCSMWSSPSASRSCRPKYLDVTTWGKSRRHSNDLGGPEQEREQLLAMLTVRPRSANIEISCGTRRANWALFWKKQIASSTTPKVTPHQHEMQGTLNVVPAKYTRHQIWPQ